MLNYSAKSCLISVCLCSIASCLSLSFRYCKCFCVRSVSLLLKSKKSSSAESWVLLSPSSSIFSLALLTAQMQLQHFQVVVCIGLSPITNWTALSMLLLADRTYGHAIGTVLRPSSSSSVTLCIVAKRCVLEQKLLLRAYRKSYIRNRLVPK